MLACFLLRLKQMVEDIEAVPIELCLFFSAKMSIIPVHKGMLYTNE